MPASPVFCLSVTILLVTLPGPMDCSSLELGVVYSLEDLQAPGFPVHTLEVRSAGFGTKWGSSHRVVWWRYSQGRLSGILRVFPRVESEGFQ